MRPTLSVSALVALLLAASALPLAAQEPGPPAEGVKVVHLVVDGLDPSMIGPQTPVLEQLRTTSTWYEEARAVMASETLPNHVAMATGAYPGRNGIPGNTGRVAPGDGEEVDLGVPDNLRADSFTTAVEDACPDLRTVTVFSKAYVHGIFSADPADSDFPQPAFNIPESDHAPDSATVSYILQELAQNQPDYLFANLGDVDRAGHVDETGFAGPPAVQQAALQQSDKLIGSIVAALRGNGMWERTVLVINSDHSMDWSNNADPSTAVDLATALEADERTTGRFFVSENGGAGLVYLLDPTAADADEVLAAAREVLVGLDGIGEVLYREPNPLDPGNDLDAVHPSWNLSGTDRAGELFVTVRSGYKVGSQTSNPLPGNHGHAVTRHITMMIGGGWDGLAEPQSISPSDPEAVDERDDTLLLPEQAEQVDLAPTYGWLLGVPDPGRDDGAAQWQGRVLDEAFARRPAPACRLAAGAGPSAPDRPDAAPDPGAEPPAEDAGASLPATGGGATAVSLVLVGMALAGHRRRIGAARQ